MAVALTWTVCRTRGLDGDPLGVDVTVRFCWLQSIKQASMAPLFSSWCRDHGQLLESHSPTFEVYHLMEILSGTMDKYTAPILYQMSRRLCSGMVMVTSYGL